MRWLGIAVCLLTYVGIASAQGFGVSGTNQGQVNAPAGGINSCQGVGGGTPYNDFMQGAVGHPQVSLNESSETCSSSALGAAAASVTATLTGAVSAFTYLSSLEMSCTKATAAGTGTGTITGVNGGTINLAIDEETGFGFYWARTYVPPLASSDTNKNIVATIPAITSGGQCTVSVCGLAR